MATGIVYPPGVSIEEKIKFESSLFLEINSTQTAASSELKQEIALILKPFSPESIGKAILNGLNSNGPLADRFSMRFYEQDKIKTSSIVSYGLKPLVKLGGTDSLFALWSKSNKDDLKAENNEALLAEYIKFGVDEIRKLLQGVKANASSKQWVTDKRTQDRVLSATAINGFIICLRKLIKAGKSGDETYYKTKLRGIDTFNFSRFRSSQYGKMSDDLFDTFFK